VALLRPDVQPEGGDPPLEAWVRGRKRLPDQFPDILPSSGPRSDAGRRWTERGGLRASRGSRRVQLREDGARFKTRGALGPTSARTPRPRIDSTAPPPPAWAWGGYLPSPPSAQEQNEALGTASSGRTRTRRSATPRERLLGRRGRVLLMRHTRRRTLRGPAESPRVEDKAETAFKGVKG
jgi:hypothetical protein